MAVRLKDGEVDREVWEDVGRLVDEIGGGDWEVRADQVGSAERVERSGLLETFMVKMEDPPHPINNNDESPPPQRAFFSHKPHLFFLALTFFSQHRPPAEIRYMPKLRSILHGLYLRPKGFLRSEHARDVLPGLMVNAPSPADALEIVKWFYKINPSFTIKRDLLIKVTSEIMLRKLVEARPMGLPDPLLRLWDLAGVERSARARDVLRLLVNGYVLEIQRQVFNPQEGHRERTAGYVRQIEQYLVLLDGPERSLEDAGWAAVMINAFSWCGDYKAALDVWRRVIEQGKSKVEDGALTVVRSWGDDSLYPHACAS